MLDSLQDIASNLLLFIGVFCVLTSLLIAGVSYYAFRRVSQFTTTDVEQMREKYQKLRAKDQHAPAEKLLQKVIHQESLKCGIVGALTSFGGFYTLPVMLPADLLISTQIQGNMVDFIAAAYGQTENENEAERRIRTYLITTGGLRASETTSRIAMRYVTRLFGKGFSKIIPFIGALIGFVVNYAIARASGTAAMQWYANKAKAQRIPASNTPNTPAIAPPENTPPSPQAPAAPE